jgi:uncharacterized protein YcbK (DUF882 family)
MRIIRRREFNCTCGDPKCTAPHMSMGLWYKLNRAAIAAGVSDVIGVRCGSRCSAINESFGGSVDSPHMDGNAADINIANLTNDQKVRFVHALARLRIPELGARPGFIHIGNKCKTYNGGIR